MVVCTSTGKASADYIFCGTNSGDIVKLYVDFLANGQAHHIFSRFLNLRNLIRNSICFFSIQVRSFLLRSKMPIHIVLLYHNRKR